MSKKLIILIDKSLLDANYKEEETYMFQSKPYDGSEIEVSHRLKGFNDSNKKQYVKELLHRNSILEKNRIIKPNSTENIQILENIDKNLLELKEQKENQTITSTNLDN